MPDDPNDPSIEPPPDAETKRSGRVTHDSRGNAVWEWQTSTGVFTREVNTQRLKKLSAAELKLTETQPVSKPDTAESAAAEAARRKAEQGFNPYESDARAQPLDATRLKSVYAEHRSDAPRHKPAARPRQSGGLWQRLKSLFRSD